MRLLSSATILLVGGCQQAAPVEPLKINGGQAAEIAAELISAVEAKDDRKLAILAPAPKDIRWPGRKFDVQQLKTDGCHWIEATAHGSSVQLSGRCEAPPCVTPWKAEMEVADKKVVAGAVDMWDC